MCDIRIPDKAGPFLMDWKRHQSADKGRKCENCPDETEARSNFSFLPQRHKQAAVTYARVSALACKLVPVLRAFSSLWQSVDFVNELRPPPN